MSSDDSTNLEPPKQTINDPGAHELVESSDSDDNFLDARSDQDTSSLQSSIPVTRVENVDNEHSHEKAQDIGVQNMSSEYIGSDRGASEPGKQEEKERGEGLFTPGHIRRPSTPGGHPIPTTIVERIDDMPAYGETPGTEAHKMREADAVPDLVIRSPHGSRSGSVSSFTTRSRAGSTPGDLPIPITRVEKVDDEPSFGEVPGTEAYEKREEDAQPDEIAVVGDVPGLPTTIDRSEELDTEHLISDNLRNLSPGEYDETEDGDANMGNVGNVEDEGDVEGQDEEFGDDFDDFEEGDEGEFGDFDDGFQEPEAVASPPQQSLLQSPFSTLDFQDLKTHEEILRATEPHMEALFPPDTIDITALPFPTQSNSIFLTDRSASLWSQLVAPPPLQPPNWIRSRIRRLFLVSLGVPVDLDEILPASKQKKLILPSTLSVSSPRDSMDSRSQPSALNRLKASEADSTTSVDSAGKPKDPSKSKSRRGPPPPPELDIVRARQLCSITDEKLNGLDEEELKEHVSHLKILEGLAADVLEYWTKRTDEKLGDREAFEGVIENLVKHARKVRK